MRTARAAAKGSGGGGGGGATAAFTKIAGTAAISIAFKF